MLAMILCGFVAVLTPLSALADVPTTLPATQPAPTLISSDARTLLDAVDAAYGKLKSLELAGTMSQDIRVDGRRRAGSASFTSSFLAPNFFRHQVKGNMECGSTGQKAFSYLERMRLYTLADAPKERTSLDELPQPMEALIDPSLMLTIAAVPSAALSRNATDISKGGDAAVDGAAFPTLVVKQKTGVVLTLLLDPRTHLVHRALTDARGELEAKGSRNVESALLTIDYTTVAPGADLKGEQFAWAPPEGARDAAARHGQGEEMGASALEGKAAPDFKLSGLDDKQVSLADLKGSVVIVDFWATWCPPCRASLPHLDETYAKFKGDGLKVYAINVGEEKQQVQAFVDKTKLAVPVLLDSDSAVLQKYEGSGIPETVVIGKDGKIRKVLVGFGPGSEDEIVAAVKAAMAE